LFSVTHLKAVVSFASLQILLGFIDPGKTSRLQQRAKGCRGEGRVFQSSALLPQPPTMALNF
jgi:hypothetical protein